MALSRRRNDQYGFSTLLIARRLVPYFSEQPSSIIAALKEQSLSVMFTLCDPWLRIAFS
jgi:hypothetical protein